MFKFRLEGKDIMTVFFETATAGPERRQAERELRGIIKAKLSLTVLAKAVDIGELPRSEKKSRRIFDNRY